MEIEDYVYSLLREKGVVLLNAYPGFGKSRIAIGIARRWVEDGGEVLVLTRSRAEALQLCQFAVGVGIRDRVALFLGRESLCPFNAQDSRQCLINRMSGVCKVQRVEFPKPVLTCNPLELFNEGLCPYEVNEALTYQLPIVVATHAHLSSPELYGRLMEVVNGWAKPLVIVDEFHNMVVGLESSIPMEVSEVRRWASMGNKVAEMVLGRIRDVVPQREVVVLRRFDIDDLLMGSSEFSDKALEMLAHFGNDMCAFTYDGKLVRLRCLSLRPIRDLLTKAGHALLLTASISRRFSHIVNTVVKSAHYVEVDLMPREYQENLTVVSIVDVELTHRNRSLRKYLDIVDKGIRVFIESAPPAGGLAVFFPSMDYMSTYLSTHSPPIWGVPTFVLGDADSTKMITVFKESARTTKSVIITYAQNPSGEGINFLENELVGVMMIGFPLPQYSQWGFLKARYYQRIGIGGFTTAFLFPAISTTVQVVGRLLRGLERHRKVAVLFDGRYYRYRRYMPRWLYMGMRVTTLSQFLNNWSWP